MKISADFTATKLKGFTIILNSLFLSEKSMNYPSVDRRDVVDCGKFVQQSFDHGNHLDRGLSNSTYETDSMVYRDRAKHENVSSASGSTAASIQGTGKPTSDSLCVCVFVSCLCWCEIWLFFSQYLESKNKLNCVCVCVCVCVRTCVK